MSNVVNFPGSEKTTEPPTPKEILEAVKDMPLKYIVVIAVQEDSKVAVIGNTFVPQGVYLIELGKKMLLEYSNNE